MIKRIFKASKNFNLYFLCLAVLSSLYDIASTIFSIKAVGYQYEGNVFIRQVIQDYGVLGFVCVKFSISFLALLLIYFIIKYRDDFGWKNVKKFYDIYVGTIISSAFVATSNLSVVYAGNSFYLLDLDSLQIGLFLLFVVPVMGLFVDLQWD